MSPAEIRRADRRRRSRRRFGLMAGLLASAMANHRALGDDPALDPDYLILGDARPVRVRLRAKVAGQPPRASWLAGVEKVGKRLDRDGDGKVSVDEASRRGIVDFWATVPAPPNGANVQVAVAPSPGAPPDAPKARAGLDLDKDGFLTVGELAEAFRPTLGPLRLVVARAADSGPGYLFDHLDRDKDGQLTRFELATIAGTLRKLDANDDESINQAEVAALRSGPMMAAAMAPNPAGGPNGPPSAVIEVAEGEVPLRTIRAILKRYDVRSSRGGKTPDNKLSIDEFALPPEVFRAADPNGDGLLTTEELRKYLSKAGPDAVIDVDFADGPAAIKVAEVAKGVEARAVGDEAVEVDAGPVRVVVDLEVGLDQPGRAARALGLMLKGADANDDGYVETAELSADDGRGAPLAPLFPMLDLDGDGKLYPAEVDRFVADRDDEAKGWTSILVDDQGSALFGRLDRDHDRRLGAREVLEASDRVAGSDRDGDGKVSPKEFPYQVRLTIARGAWLDRLGPFVGALAEDANGDDASPGLAKGLGKGPGWFRKMDRNRDGDVSRREFLGPREAFDRLDRDRDGLIGPSEGDAATSTKP